LLEAANAANARAEPVSEQTLAEVCATETPQGIAALFKTPPLRTPQSPPADPFLLVLDGVSDPGNLGTILRTAWAVGLREVCLLRGSADPWAPKSVRAGMGAQFAVRIARLEDLCELRAWLHSAGWDPPWLTVPNGGVSAFSEDFAPERSALVLGGEAHGVSAPDAGRQVTLPMPGDAESLNAAQAATVFLFETVRRNILHSSANPPQTRPQSLP
jgi:TrmH family RNA methyltransferase